VVDSVAGIPAPEYCTYSGIYSFIRNRSRSAI